MASYTLSAILKTDSIYRLIKMADFDRPVAVIDVCIWSEYDELQLLIVIIVVPYLNVTPFVRNIV